jgi:hypothetical protein
VGFTSSGDLAFDPSTGFLFLSSPTGGVNDQLVLIDPGNPAGATAIGNIGFAEVFGLDFHQNTLFGSTLGGLLLTVNPATGAGTAIANHGLSTFGISVDTQVVTIDIKPGSDPNGVNPRSKGVIPVAVLGSVDFDATQVDFSTVVFGPGEASPVHDGHVEDVNADALLDMVFHFKVSDTGIACGDPNATLTGETFGGDSITGTDAVKTAGCNSSGGGAIAMIFLWMLGWAAISRRSRQ